MLTIQVPVLNYSHLDFLILLSIGVHSVTGKEQWSHSFPHEHFDQGPSGFLHWRKVKNLHGVCVCNQSVIWLQHRVWFKMTNVNLCVFKIMTHVHIFPPLAPQIAMVSPGMTSCEYTMNTLRYADRCIFNFVFCFVLRILIKLDLGNFLLFTEWKNWIVIPAQVEQPRWKSL